MDLCRLLVGLGLLLLVGQLLLLGLLATWPTPPWQLLPGASLRDRDAP